MTVICLDVDLFLTCLQFVGLLGLVTFNTFRRSSHYFVKYFFLLLSSFWDFHYVCIGIPVSGVSHTSGSVHFYLFSLLFILENLYWSIFYFADYFSATLIGCRVPVANFHFIYCNFQLQDSIEFTFKIFISLLIFYIWLVIVIIFSFKSLNKASFSTENIYNNCCEIFVS